MAAPSALSRAAAWLGFALSGLATLLWVGCALPSGIPEGGSLIDDGGTPLFRQPWLLVPALVLLVLGPAAVALTPGPTGRRTVLAGMDAFVTLHAALLLTLRHGLPRATDVHGLTPVLLVGGLHVLAGLSVLETVRLLRGGDRPVIPWLGGLRLALCLLVLLLPSGPLLVGGQERASLLGPFLFVALSAGGARLARGPEGLGLTAALLHLLLALHVLITLRFTLYQEAPRVLEPTVVGRTTLDLALGLVALAGLQVLVEGLACLRLKGAPAPRAGDVVAAVEPGA